VLLRQRFPQIPVLRKVLELPGSRAFLTWLVQNWNYHIALEDYPTQQGSRGELGAPEWRRSRTGLSDELISQLQDWVQRAQAAEGAPYFGRWDGRQSGTPSPFGCTDKFGPQREDTREGTYGLKRSYVQMTPAAEFAPLTAGPYKQFLQTWQALQNTAIGAGLSVPAAFATYKTITPAMADLGSKATELM